MYGRALAAALVIAVIAGAGAGYLVGSQSGPTTTSTKTSTTASTIATTMTSTATTISTTTATSLATTTATTTLVIPTTSTAANLINASQAIQSACAYLASEYNTPMSLIAETPSHQRYYLYSDNYLAMLVLLEDCNNPALAQSLNETLSHYDPSKLPNQYMVLGCSGPYFAGSRDIDLSGKLWTTVNNRTGALLNDSYADIAFLQAYYNKVCAGQLLPALATFDAGVSEYDGKGFDDIPYRVGASSGVYQTYKLALYIYIAQLLNQKVPPSVLVSLMMMQAPSGGFYTGYDVNYSIGSATTNTETTCLVIMALRAAFG